MEQYHGTTILGVKKGGKTVIAGDGQVSLGNTVIKPNATKVRRIGAEGKVIGGFAGEDWLLNDLHELHLTSVVDDDEADPGMLDNAPMLAELPGAGAGARAFKTSGARRAFDLYGAPRYLGCRWIRD